MAETNILTGVTQRRSGVPLAQREAPRIPVVVFGTSLGLFLGLTYIACVLFDLWFPEQAMHPAWQAFLPGFTWLTWPSFLLGLVESVAYGWYVALIFGPLYNFFAGRFPR